VKAVNQRISEAINQANLGDLLVRCKFGDAKQVVCGVSGGADSMALMVLALANGHEVEAVHVDHGIRESSDSESELVSYWADYYGASFRSEKVDLSGGSDLEQRARIARHSVLGKDALTGHTADDNAETILINLLRGAGPKGLSGIEPGPKHPILALRRSETQQICDDLEITPFEDPSNSDERFVRNNVRSDLIPMMNQISDRDIVPLLCRTGEVNRQTTDYIAEQSAGLDPTNAKVLKGFPSVIQSHVLREWLRDELGHPPTNVQLSNVLDVLNNKTIACEISGGRRIARTEGVLRIEP